MNVWTDVQTDVNLEIWMQIIPYLFICPYSFNTFIDFLACLFISKLRIDKKGRLLKLFHEFYYEADIETIL